MSQKKQPPKTFCNVSTQAKNILLVKFCQFVASLYPHLFTSFDLFILIFKMALIFLGVLIVFTISSFSKSGSLDLLQMMSGPNSPNLNPLDYQVYGQCWSLITSCNANQKQFLV